MYYGIVKLSIARGDVVMEETDLISAAKATELLGVSRQTIRAREGKRIAGTCRSGVARRAAPA